MCCEPRKDDQTLLKRAKPSDAIMPLPGASAPARLPGAGRDVRAPVTPALPARAVVREDVELADDEGTWKPTKRGKRAGRGGDVAAQAERYEARYGAAATRK